MKLALITPKGILFSTDLEMINFAKININDAAKNFLLPQRGNWSGGNIGLLIIAALTPQDFTIDFVDENHEDINFDVDYDLVGISAMTQQATRAYEIADEFRKRGVKVVIGGIHATVLPDEAKEHADVVVIGEAENTWSELIDDFIKGQIRPFYKSTTPVDLKKSPLPRYDLLKKYDYKMIWVQTSRGCPRDCEFCAASKVYGKTYRRKTIEQVFREINYIRGFWDEPAIYFADDNMFVNKTYSYELVKRLAQTGLRWVAQTDVSVAEDEMLLKLMQNSGCIFLFIGFETLSKEGKLDKHGWKQRYIDKYPETIKKIQSRGIGVFGAFIVGLDEDDVFVFEKLSDFIISNHLFTAQITVLTPLPGTRLRQRLIEEGRVLSSDWQRYTLLDVNFMPKQMSPEELQKGILNVYKRVYSKDNKMAVVQHFKEIYARLHERNNRLIRSYRAMTQ